MKEELKLNHFNLSLVIGDIGTRGLRGEGKQMNCYPRAVESRLQKIEFSKTYNEITFLLKFI